MGFWAFGARVLGVGFRVSGFGFWVINDVPVLGFLVFRARILGFGFSDQGCRGLWITDEDLI